MTPARSRRAVPRAAALLALLALTVLLAACGSSDDGDAATAASSSGSSTPKPFELRYGFVSNSGKLEGPAGFYDQGDRLAADLKSAGVTGVKLIPFPNGPNVAAALVSGSIDVADFGDTPALVAGAQGVPAKLLGFYAIGNNAWLVGRKGGPTSIEGLAGKKVATAKGSYMDRYLGGLLAERGLTGKVQVSALLPPAGVAAIQKGSLDAFAFPYPLGELLKSQGFPVLDEAKDHPGLTGNGLTLISDGALKAHPQLVAAWRAEQQKSIDAVKADPDAYWAFIAKLVKIPVAVAKASYPLSSLPSEPYPADAFKGLQGTLDYLVKTKQAKSFDLAGWKVGG
jgi:sulfonate transport system substrate-binding protein